MRVVTITCDRCGEPATDRVRVWWHLAQANEKYDMDDRDLCRRCADELRGWLGAGREDK